jgi:hypothetical protein
VFADFDDSETQDDPAYIAKAEQDITHGLNVFLHASW